MLTQFHSPISRSHFARFRWSLASVSALVLALNTSALLAAPDKPMPTLIDLQNEAVKTAPAPAQPLVFAYFKGNGEDGLHLAESRDGLTWTALNGDKSFLAPEAKTLMRDPNVLRGPDGEFHLVYTTSWDSRDIGLAHSRDLIHWTKHEFIPVMKDEPTARNCWAPETFYDEATRQYLIFWSTTIPGRFPETDAFGDDGYNHRIYYTSTPDFKTFAPTKLFYDNGFNVIDATLIQVGSKYALVVKDETRDPEAKKNLRIAVSDKAEGPYGPASTPFTNNWVEGPSVLKIGDAWTVYYDEYTRGHYGALRTRDFVNWEDVTPQIKFPQGVRHGTAFAVPESVLTGLEAVGK